MTFNLQIGIAFRRLSGEQLLRLERILAICNAHAYAAIGDGHHVNDAIGALASLAETLERAAACKQ